MVSPDSLRVAYHARRGEQNFVVVDGAEGTIYESIGKPPIFSPDSRRVAYDVRISQERRIVIDGAEVKTYDRPFIETRLVFEGSNRLRLFAVRGGKVLRVEIVMP